MALPVADLWFGIESVESGLFRIREIHIDPYLAGHMWLVRGRNADLLIDTGTGIRPLRQTVDAIADKPVKAVALNCFYDHAGGLHEFTIRLAHRADVPAIEHPDGRSSVADEYVSDDMLRALPHEGFSASNYQIRPAKVTDPLDDGDIIDLGNRRLEVIHTPGVTAGSICLWESATGNLFTSDLLFFGPEGEKARPRDHDSFVSSLRRLEALPVSKVWPGHFDSLDCSAMKALIDSYLWTSAKDAIAAIPRALLYQHGVEAHFVALEGVLWARISAHVYNEIGDLARLAEALPGVLAEQPWLAEG